MSFRKYCEIKKPYLLKEWDTSKNGNFDDSIALYSRHKYWFVCSECETSFQTSPHSLVRSNFNCCPKCWIKRRGEGRHAAAYSKHSLLETNPELSKEFDSDANRTTPDKVSINDNKKYWWKCSTCGFRWQAAPYNRNRGTGCPKCNKITHTSFPEQAIFFYVSKEYPDTINGDKHLGVELDIFIPSINIAIEYDGEAWHQNIKKDEKKNSVCEKNKIKLIRIREKSCWFWPQTAYLKCISAESGSNDSLKEAIEMLFFELRNDLYCPDINIFRDEIEIKSQYMNAKLKNSLLEKYPEISKEWNYEKNYPVKPDNVDYGSGTKYWWICPKCGYEYQMTPNSRTCKGSGCPVCAHDVPLQGVNDFKTINPELMKEWDYERNNALNLDPSKLLPKSEKKAWWICTKCGHRWQSMICNRKNGRGCPVCAKNNHKRKVINIDTGMRFNSVNEAGAFYGKEKNHHINECCQGKRKTALGFHWKYDD